MIPKVYQVEKAMEGYSILKEHAIVYLAMEERTGKTLTSILIAEFCKGVESVLVITKKKALAGWTETLLKYTACKKFDVTNYHQASKKDPSKYDLIILDEAHNYISSYPKPSAMWLAVKKLTAYKPLIYLSATPHAQGYQQLYHQFALSSWSPWKKFGNFYNWFRVYGVPTYAYVNGEELLQYTETEEDLVKATCGHLFVTSTRQALGFEHEPVDKIHYVELDKATTEVYNTLIKDNIVYLDGKAVVCDTKSKLRSCLHMLEGGTVKIGTNRLVLPNNEKIQYILSTWGDSDELVIFYNYIEEQPKLEEFFKKATILQATSFAEGVDLAHKETIVIYSQDFSTARHSQRRARQAAQHRDKPITIHFLLVKDAISEQVYETVSVNKTNFVDAVFKRKQL